MNTYSNNSNIGYTIEKISELNKEIPDLKRKSQINLALGYAGTFLSYAAIAVLAGSGIGTIPMILGGTIIGVLNGVSIQLATKGHQLSDEANKKQSEINEEFLAIVRKINNSKDPEINIR